MRRLARHRASWLGTFALVISFAGTADGSPPYASSEADVAPEGVLEVHLGLGRLERAEGGVDVASPLLDASLGIGHGLELSAELEFEPEEGRLGHGALGVKWASGGERMRIGVETLALLPVSSRDSGLGNETQLLVTLRRLPFLLHANAGGFYDGRPDGSEHGWNGGLLGEWEADRARVGAEAVAWQRDGAGVAVLAGAGVVWSFGGVDARAALHVGLTEEAPDLMASLWLTTTRPLW